jgi:hypothetical protein
VIKPNSISWAGHVTSMEDMINTQFVEYMKRGGNFGNLSKITGLY